MRYEFHIEHPKWFPLTVGTDCCDRLTESNAAFIIKREKERLNRFLSSKSWQPLPHGITIRRKKMDFEIASDPRGYFISMLNKAGRKRFPTISEAKTAVFNLIESGEATSFVAKQKVK
jgi:hypothetical protein